MRKRILFLLLMAIVSVSESWALNFSVTVASGQTLKFKTTTGNDVEVSAPGFISGTLVIPSTVTYDDVTYNVTSIGYSAFSNSFLTSVTIPNSVTSIGNYAFENCSSLNSITIPNSVTTIGNNAFDDCSSLNSITIPNSVTTIGYSAFRGCSGLTSINLPDAVVSIGHSIFYGCSNLTTIYIGSGLTSIGSNAFQNCNSLTAVNVSVANTAYSSVDGVLFNKTGNTLILCPHAHDGNLTIGINVTTVNTDALNGCTIDTLFLNAISCQWLNNNSYGVEMPTIQVLEVGEDVDYLHSRFVFVPGLQYINVHEDNWNYHSAGGMLVSAGGHTVKRCPAARSGALVMPQVVNRVADSAFFGCTALTSIDLNNVHFVGKHAFMNCTGLQSITIPTQLDSIVEGAFSGNGADTLYYNAIDGRAYSRRNNGSYYPTEDASLFGSDSLMVVVMSDGVQNIPPGAFNGCTWLQSVTLPSGLSRIKPNTFRNCSSLASIILPDSLICIEPNVFWGCSALSNIVFPTGLDTIGDNAFHGCTSLTGITLPDSLRYIGANAFEDCSALTSFTVPPAVRHIGSEALKNCPSLKDLYYNAISVHQWDTIWHHCAVGLDEWGNSIYDTCIDYIGYRNGGVSVDMLAGTTLVERMVVGEGVNDMTAIWQTGVDTLILPQSLKFVSSGYSYYQGTVLRNTPGISNLRYVYFNCKNLIYQCWSEKRVNNEGWFNSYVMVPYMHEMAHGVFPGSVNMRHVIFGDSVQSIPAYCFRDCRNVREFVNLVVPSTVTYIGGGAFDGCTQMRSVNIHSGVTRIGSAPFLGCRQLNRIEYHAVSATDASDVVLPDIVTYTDYSTNPLSYDNVAHTPSLSRFSSVALTEMLPPVDTIVIGAGVRHVTSCLIGYPWMQTLDSVPRTHATYIDNQSTTLQTIGLGAFANMWITNVQTLICDSLKVIGDGAFRNSRGFSKIDLPYGVASIGNAAFMNCPDIDSVILPSSVQTIGKNAFAYDSSLSYLYYNCDSAYIDFDVDFGQPFGQTPQLNNIVFGPDVRHLTKSMFMNCEGLNHLELNEGLISIGPQCFMNFIASSHEPHYPQSSALNTVVLPSSLQSIGEKAFLVAHISWFHGATGIGAGPANSGIDTIFCRSTTPPVLESNYTDRISSNIYDYAHKYGNVFNWGLDTMAVLVVPCGCLSAYSTESDPYWETGWTSFTTIIEKAPFDIQLTVNVDTMGTATWACATGGNISLTATPTDHHHFVGWSDGDTSNPRTLTVSSDTALQAQFAWGNLYQVTVQSANNSRGSATGSGTYVENSVDTLTATANYGYHFDHWNDGDTTNPRLLTVTASGTYTATFMPNQYTLAVSSEDSAHGTVSGSGAYNFNTSHTITATPTTGYHFTQWNDGNTSNPRSIMITRDTAFVASFAINIYSLTVASADATMGGASADTSHYEHGDTATLLATPQYGYHFDHWNDGNTDNPRLVVMTQNKSLTAVFAANTYIVATQSDSLQGSVAGGGTYDYLYNVQLTAAANYGYHFSSWSDGNTDNPRTLQVTQDTTLEALFLPNSYTLTLASNDPVHGNTQGGGTYLYLDTVQISVSGIAPHYHFSSWSDGSTDSVRNIVIVSDSSITANFAIDQHELTVLSADDEYGSVSGSGLFDYGTSATIQATPAAGYYFVSWSNGEIANPATVDVMCDTMVTATFAPELEANLYMVSVEDGRNTLLWRAEPTAVTYNILRESSVAGVYETVDTLQSEETMTWVDTASRPESRSYRYRLEAMDQWNTIFTGPVHKTMHLTINRGVGSNWNLVWTEYEGTQFNTYIIYRGTSPSDMAEIDRLPVGGNTTYTDANAPSSDLYYQVGIVPAQPMFSPGKASDVILSNIAESATVGITSAQTGGIAVTSSHEGICIMGTPGMEVEVYSVDGRLVDKRVSSAERSTIVVPSGVYLVRVDNLPPQKVVVLR